MGLNGLGTGSNGLQREDALSLPSGDFAAKPRYLWILIELIAGRDSYVKRGRVYLEKRLLFLFQGSGYWKE